MTDRARGFAKSLRKAATGSDGYFVRAFLGKTPFIVLNMMLWLLAVVLLAAVAALGYRQGAIRVAFSLVGIIMGALLAGLLGKLIKPVLVGMGVKNPILPGLLAPLIVFLVISILFKVAAFMVHQKVDVYFKYHAGDLRLALWERLSHRLGLCLGLVNGALYLILIAFVIYPFGYWTVQFATPGEDPKSMRILNGLSWDMQNSGFAKVAEAIQPMPKVWYEAADLAGLIYNNALLEARLSRYPAFLGLAERSEFQDMGNDTQFTELLLSRKPIMTVLDYPKAQAILQNPDLLKLIWSTAVPNFNDLRTYLETGKSPKYDPEKILGRWTFNLNVTMSLFRRAKPNITSKEMLGWKRWMMAVFNKTSFVAMTDHQAILKNLPSLKPLAGGAAGTATPQTLKGQWKSQDNGYELNLSGAGRDEQLPAAIEGDRLTIAAGGLSLAFDRED